MLFNSQTYLAFLPSVVIMYWLLKPSWRPVLLLGASYVFYAYWNAAFLALIILLTVGNFGLGLLRDGRVDRRARVLIAALVLDLGALAIFKYLGLFDQTVASVVRHLGISSFPVAHILLPLGLSFFTFEFIHYHIELFRGGPVVRNLLRFALFPAFFPTQIAGPIKRYRDFIGQVERQPSLDWPLFAEGIAIVVGGLVKKTLADSMMPIVTTVFTLAPVAGAIDAWVGAVAFALEIYLDFSGYTDIARGSAQLFGYTVPVNFRAPYLSTTLQDFWRRWHISLSSWLRDYLYIPLGGSRRGRNRTRLNLIVTMALGGLWHGAAWHFMVWGVAHGMALAGYSEVRDLSPRLWQRLPSWAGIIGGWLLTQCTVLTLWVVFRAPSLSIAASLLKHMAVGPWRYPTLLDGPMIGHVAVLATALIGLELALQGRSLWNIADGTRWRSVARPTLVTAMALFAAYQSALLAVPVRFIYFQF
jgi:alginate O-acetyltransferase complex protein AlgI